MGEGLGVAGVDTVAWLNVYETIPESYLKLES